MKNDTIQKCLPCPTGAFCAGGDILTPLFGFWRGSNLSTLIIECPVKESCLGLSNSTTSDPEILTKGLCLEGHWGALCYECAKGFARFRSNSLCKTCKEQPIIYIKMIISALFLIIYTTFQAKIFSRMEKKDPNIAVSIKLLLNHLQLVGMISLIDLGWTLDFDFYFNFLDYISFLTEDSLVIDCLVQTIDEDLLVIKIIFSTLLPIILSLVMLLLWLVLFFYLNFYRNRNESEIDQHHNKKNSFSNYLIEKMRITTLVVVYILYPEILRKCFSLMNCVELDNSTGHKALNLSPNIECWNKHHTFWVLAVGVPGLVLWGIMIPGLILKALVYYKNYIQTLLGLRDFYTLVSGGGGITNIDFTMKEVAVKIESGKKPYDQQLVTEKDSFKQIPENNRKGKQLIFTNSPLTPETSGTSKGKKTQKIKFQTLGDKDCTLQESEESMKINPQIFSPKKISDNSPKSRWKKNNSVNKGNNLNLRIVMNFGFFFQRVQPKLLLLGNSYVLKEISTYFYRNFYGVFPENCQGHNVPCYNHCLHLFAIKI